MLRTHRVKDFLTSSLFVIVSFKGYLFAKLFWSLVLVAIPTTIMCVLNHLYPHWFKYDGSLPGLLGAALGFMLVFRNNTAYERWWEARKVLGSLVNTSRNLMVQFSIFAESNLEKEKFAKLAIAFCYSLKEHLRDGVQLEELAFLEEKILSQVSDAKHKPLYIAQLMTKKVNELFKAGQISDLQRFQLSQQVDELVNILGKCERIHNTPMPVAHTYLLKLYIFVYVLIIPFGFMSTIGYWSIPTVVVIYFIIMSIVFIAEEIEDPFGTDPNDLPVDRIVLNIENNLYQLIDEN